MSPPRHSTDAEIAALETVCDRLAGFGADVSMEWLDGYFCALLASRRTVPPSEWLPKVFDDGFGRTFADPVDAQQAMAALMARWNVIAHQLDPQSLIDDPDQPRLQPLMMECDDELRAEAVAAGHMSADEAADRLQTGSLWAEGFMSAVDDFPEDWPEPELDTEDGAWYDDCLMRVEALTLGVDALAVYVAEAYDADPPTRDQLIDDAGFAVQDLRVYWLDHAPRPATRRVEPKPGRNDLCPCGSGRKYKKCHGAI